MTSFGARLLTGGVLAAIGLIAIKVVTTVLSGAFALIAFLLFTVLPILAAGWIVIRLFRYLARNGRAQAFE
jgi:hypothetical protein